eukprot:scpid50210/ scgid9199/ Ammonium transporter Rh type B-B; Rhesus blood group family type B glycoprotein B
MSREDFVSRKKFSLLALFLQALFILLFGLFTEYKINEARPSATNDSEAAGFVNGVDALYPMFMDVHSMMFLGFGFLMAFLSRYGYSSIGLNFLLGAFILQWATLSLGFFHQYPDFNKNIQIDLTNLLTADFAAAAVMITFGAVLGKVSSTQLLVIGLMEIIFFSVNEMIGVKIFKAVDIGGSIFVHTFGAYFGLGLSRMLSTTTRHARKVGSSKEGAIYHSDLFAMLGAIILWLYWPSFNGSPASGDQRHRVVINTYYSLSACVVVTFAFSALFSKEGKIDMVHVQNATLAGGVAVGSTADFLIEPWGAMFLGSLAGLISVSGYVYLQPFLQKHLHLHDTCGVHNLHGMPGVLAALGSAVAVKVIDTSKYGNTLGKVLPAVGDGRSASSQAGYQIAALVVTLVIALAGGAFTGLVLRFWGGALDAVKDDEENMFDDAVHWHVGADTLEQSNVTLPAPVNASLAAASSAAADGDGIKLRRTLTEMSETDAEQAMRAADRARESAI